MKFIGAASVIALFSIVAAVPHFYNEELEGIAVRDVDDELALRGFYDAEEITLSRRVGNKRPPIHTGSDGLCMASGLCKDPTKGSNGGPGGPACKSKLCAASYKNKGKACFCD